MTAALSGMSASRPIVLVGAGNMGGAMLAGWLKSGIPGSSVIVVDPAPSEKMAALIAECGATHVTKLASRTKAGVLFLALKPQVMEAVLPTVKDAVGADTVVVSVAAGKTLAFFEAQL